MNPPPNSAELLAKAKRLEKPAAIAAFAGVILFVVSLFIQAGASGEDLDTSVGVLNQYAEHGGTLVVGKVIYGLSWICFTLPLYALFVATRARTDRLRSSLVAFCFIGPVLLAVQAPLVSVGYKDVGEKFAAGETAAAALYVQAGTTDAETTVKPEGEDEKQTPATSSTDEGATDDEEDDPEEQRADDLIEDNSMLSVAQPLILPALLGMVTILVFLPMWASRAGLLTRFWGSLSMALGIALLFLPFAQLGLILWFVALGFLLLDMWPGGRPPAWAAGVAVPWPKPGEQPPEDPGGPGGTVEGSGRDVSDEGPDPEANGAGGPNGNGGPGGPGGPGGGPELPPGPSDPPRKRKRRG